MAIKCPVFLYNEQGRTMTIVISIPWHPGTPSFVVCPKSTWSPSVAAGEGFRLVCNPWHELRQIVSLAKELLHMQVSLRLRLWLSSSPPPSPPLKVTKFFTLFPAFSLTGNLHSLLQRLAVSQITGRKWPPPRFNYKWVALLGCRIQNRHQDGGDSRGASRFCCRFSGIFDWIWLWSLEDSSASKMTFEFF